MRIKQFMSALLVLAFCSLGALLGACDDGDSGDAGDSGDTVVAGDTSGGDAGGDAGGETPSAGEPEEASVWGATCRVDQECAAPTDFCVKQPGQEEGYCTYACTNNAECTDLEAPSDWSCNTLSFAGCEDIPSNWCGPVQELLDFPGTLIECP